MHTVLHSRFGVETVIRPDQPFVISGERINPAGRQALTTELLVGNFKRVKADAVAQVQAGATVLDVNAVLGLPSAHELEPEVMIRAIGAVRSTCYCASTRRCQARSLPGSRRAFEAQELAIQV